MARDDVFLTQQQLVLLKLETTYGSDSAPTHTASFDAIKLVDPFTLDLGQEVVEQVGGTLSRGRIRPIGTKRPIGVTFRSYLAGTNGASLAAAVKHPLASALQACALQETFAAAQYTYQPTSDVQSDASVTIIAHQDGYEHRILGAQGNVNLIFSAAAPPIAEFNFRGILSTEASTVRAAATGLTAAIPPRWIDSGSFVVGSWFAEVENLNFNTNNTLYEQPASKAGSGSGIMRVVVTARQPGGSMDPAATQPGSFDFIGSWRATSGAIMRLAGGSQVGNRFTLTASQVVFKTVGWGDKSGLSIFNVDYEAYEVAGNDQFALSFT